METRGVKGPAREPNSSCSVTPFSTGTRLERVVVRVREGERGRGKKKASAKALSSYCRSQTPPVALSLAAVAQGRDLDCKGACPSCTLPFCQTGVIWVVVGGGSGPATGAREQGELGSIALAVHKPKSPDQTSGPACNKYVVGESMPRTPSCRIRVYNTKVVSFARGQ